MNDNNCVRYCIMNSSCHVSNVDFRLTHVTFLCNFERKGNIDRVYLLTFIHYSRGKTRLLHRAYRITGRDSTNVIVDARTQTQIDRQHAAVYRTMRQLWTTNHFTRRQFCSSVKCADGLKTKKKKRKERKLCQLCA